MEQPKSSFRPMKSDFDNQIRDILGEDAYNEGAFMFDDNKMRFCFTIEELEKKISQIKQLIKSEVIGEREETIVTNPINGKKMLNTQLVIRNRLRKEQRAKLE